MFFVGSGYGGLSGRIVYSSGQQSFEKVFCCAPWTMVTRDHDPFPGAFGYTLARRVRLGFGAHRRLGFLGIGCVIYGGRSRGAPD